MCPKMFIEEFEKLYLSHLNWLHGKEGKRLEIHNRDFSYMDLSNLDLTDSILTHNVFRATNFKNSRLTCADLSNNILYGADFTSAILYGARLNGNNFINTNFKLADMRFCEVNGSDFRRAKTKGTNINNIKIDVTTGGFPLTCPEKGSFTAYKRAQGYIIELLVLEDAKRSSAFGRKCRCDKAKVISITKKTGEDADITSLPSDYDKNFIYTIGEIVEVPDFDDNRWNECSQGIHFFITKEEALYG